MTNERKRLIRTHMTCLCIGIGIGTALGYHHITWVGLLAWVALLLPWGEPKLFDIFSGTEASND